MKDIEKINRHDTLLNIQNIIGGSFGSADGIFAGHQNDEDRAKKIRKLAFSNKITLEEIMNMNLSYLFNQGFVFEHIKEQMIGIKKFYESKLIDNYLLDKLLNDKE